MANYDYPKPGDRVRLKQGCTGYPPLIVPGVEYEVGGDFYCAGSRSLGVLRINNEGGLRDDVWWAEQLELVGGPW